MVPQHGAEALRPMARCAIMYSFSLTLRVWPTHHAGVSRDRRHGQSDNYAPEAGADHRRQQDRQHQHGKGHQASMMRMITALTMPPRNPASVPRINTDDRRQADGGEAADERRPRPVQEAAEHVPSESVRSQPMLRAGLQRALAHVIVVWVVRCQERSEDGNHHYAHEHDHGEQHQLPLEEDLQEPSHSLTCGAMTASGSPARNTSSIANPRVEPAVRYVDDQIDEDDDWRRGSACSPGSPRSLCSTLPLPEAAPSPGMAKMVSSMTEPPKIMLMPCRPS